MGELNAQLAHAREELRLLKSKSEEQLKMEALAMMERANKLTRHQPHARGHTASGPAPSPFGLPPQRERTSAVDAAEVSADASGGGIEVTAAASGGFLPPRLGSSRPATNASVSKASPKVSLPALPTVTQSQQQEEANPSPGKPRGRRAMLPRWAAGGDNAAR